MVILDQTKHSSPFGAFDLDKNIVPYLSFDDLFVGDDREFRESWSRTAQENRVPPVEGTVVTGDWKGIGGEDLMGSWVSEWTSKRFSVKVPSGFQSFQQKNAKNVSAKADRVRVLVDELIEGKMWRKVSEKPKFCMSLLLIEEGDKGAGKDRVVMNARPINKATPDRHFKFENLEDAKKLVVEDDWFFKMDIRHCFYNVPSVLL
jgi:hypothetical protein